MNVRAILLAIGASVLCWAGWQWTQAWHPAVSVSSSHSEVVRESPSVLQMLKMRADRKGSLHYLVLGDSVALGKGASHGYAEDVADRLKQLHLPVQLDNEGVSGQTSSQLWVALHEPGMKRKIRKADLISVTIGGNDVLKAALKRSHPWEALASFNEIRDDFVNHLGRILTWIRHENPGAIVLVTSLYNPVPPDALYFPLVEKLLNIWNRALLQTVSAHPGCIVISIDRRLNPEHRDWLADQIHPNNRGHRLIATAILDTIGAADSGARVAGAWDN